MRGGRKEKRNAQVVQNPDLGVGGHCYLPLTFVALAAVGRIKPPGPQLLVAAPLLDVRLSDPAIRVGVDECARLLVEAPKADMGG